MSILIVGYNAIGFLAESIGAIEGSIRSFPYEIRFVDNGSDRSDNWVRHNFPQVAVVESRGNIGFGAANNYLAQGAEGEWLLLLNPDTRLEPLAIDRLLEAAQANREYEILGGLSFSPAGDPLEMSKIEFPTLGLILRGAIGRGRAELPPEDAPGIFEVDAVSGGFLLITREAWDRLGGFDERFFLYAEELDLCKRLSQTGGKVGLLPAARIMHAVGSGEAATPARVTLSMRGAATYYRKHFSPHHAQACLIAHWISCAVRFVLGSLLSPIDPRKAEVARSMRDATLKPWRWYAGYR